jgi:glycosyltransferase involved in cell wall biosynthesis
MHLLTGKRGWLTRACDNASVAYTVLPFPSSRSLGGRIWGNRHFISKASAVVRGLLDPSQPAVIHANDHPDSLLGVELARELNCPSILTLRTPGMSERDFLKYRCDRHRALISVGEELFDKVSAWHLTSPHSLVHDGIGSEDIVRPRETATEVLDQIVVLGSLCQRKGWHDLVEALATLEQSGTTEFPKFVFVGHHHGLDPVRELGLTRLAHCHFEFPGVIENFHEFVQGFPLAIHPSRSESFGMAAIETVAAGVPLLAGATGLIPAFIPNPQFLFEPGNVTDLASKLRSLLGISPTRLLQCSELDTAQEIIARSFTLDRTVAQLIDIYGGVLEA